jgi:hypothetical protein
MKLLEILLVIVRSYSDNIEKDFYLKEISRLLEIKESLVYDAFNKVRFKSIKKEITSQQDKIFERQKAISSTDLVISYCLFNEKNINFVKEKILFPNSI